MNRIIETIEREKIIKKHRRSVAKTDSIFLSLVPDSIMDYFDRENIKSIELREREGNKGFYWLIEHNSKPGKLHYSLEDKVPEPENSMLKETLKKIGTNKLAIKQNQNQHHDFSEGKLFAGEEYNQELVELKNQTNMNWEMFNLIDFDQHNNESPKFIERKIKEIYNEPVNKGLIEKGEFPIICFKNIEKIGQNQALEEALLPVFDKQQNQKLFNKKVDLSKFILIVTTSTHETEKLSDPLLSRLDWVNADTAQPKKFFLDKYYYWLLVPSLLINLILLVLLLLSKLKKKKIIKEVKINNMSDNNLKNCDYCQQEFKIDNLWKEDQSEKLVCEVCIKEQDDTEKRKAEKDPNYQVPKRGYTSLFPKKRDVIINSYNCCVCFKLVKFDGHMIAKNITKKNIW